MSQPMWGEFPVVRVRYKPVILNNTDSYNITWQLEFWYTKSRMTMHHNLYGHLAKKMRDKWAECSLNLAAYFKNVENNNCPGITVPRDV